MKRIKDTNNEYHSNAAISASGLKTIYKKSVFHFVNQEEFKRSHSMNFGSAVHSALLEPENDEILVLPNNLNLRLKADREAKNNLIKNNKDKIIITEKENNNLDMIKQNVKSNLLAKSLLDNLSECEYSYYGTYEDVPLKVRPDGIKKDRYIIDIKTCQDASPRAFLSAIYKYLYHLQACFYSEMLGYNDVHNQFRFIAIENVYPFDVAVYSLSQDIVNKGKQAWRNAFINWKNYYDNKLITGYQWDNINEDGSLIL